MAEATGTEDRRKGRCDAHSDAARMGALTRQRREPSMGLLKMRERRDRRESTTQITQWRRATLARARVRCSRFLTSISIRMVLALRLARRRDMVSRPPEKILSTATAEPRDGYSEMVETMRGTEED